MPSISQLSKLLGHKKQLAEDSHQWTHFYSRKRRFNFTLRGKNKLTTKPARTLLFAFLRSFNDMQTAAATRYKDSLFFFIMFIGK